MKIRQKTLTPIFFSLEFQKNVKSVWCSLYPLIESSQGLVSFLLHVFLCGCFTCVCYRGQRWRFLLLRSVQIGLRIADFLVERGVCKQVPLPFLVWRLSAYTRCLASISCGLWLVDSETQLWRTLSMQQDKPGSEQDTSRVGITAWYTQWLCRLD
jgi:hypothetical protein